MSDPQLAPAIAGIVIEEKRCPKCGGQLFRKPCPCPFKRKGWETCARCLNPACATVVGIKMRRGLRGRRRKDGLGPFGEV